MDQARINAAWSHSFLNGGDRAFLAVSSQAFTWRNARKTNIYQLCQLGGLGKHQPGPQQDTGNLLTEELKRISLVDCLQRCGQGLRTHRKNCDAYDSCAVEQSWYTANMKTWLTDRQAGFSGQGESWVEERSLRIFKPD